MVETEPSVDQPEEILPTSPAEQQEAIFGDEINQLEKEIKNDFPPSTIDQETGQPLPAQPLVTGEDIDELIADSSGKLYVVCIAPFATPQGARFYKSLIEANRHKVYGDGRSVGLRSLDMHSDLGGVFLPAGDQPHEMLVYVRNGQIVHRSPHALSIQGHKKVVHGLLTNNAAEVDEGMSMHDTTTPLPSPDDLPPPITPANIPDEEAAEPDAAPPRKKVTIVNAEEDDDDGKKRNKVRIVSENPKEVTIVNEKKKSRKKVTIVDAEDAAAEETTISIPKKPAVPEAPNTPEKPTNTPERVVPPVPERVPGPEPTDPIPVESRIQGYPITQLDKMIYTGVSGEAVPGARKPMWDPEQDLFYINAIDAGPRWQDKPLLRINPASMQLNRRYDKTDALYGLQLRVMIQLDPDGILRVSLQPSAALIQKRKEKKPPIRWAPITRPKITIRPPRDRRKKDQEDDAHDHHEEETSLDKQGFSDFQQWPTKSRNISSEYGMRNGHMHRGIDITPDDPTSWPEVKPVLAWEVVYVEKDYKDNKYPRDFKRWWLSKDQWTYGNCVIVRHAPGNKYTFYAHLKHGSINVKRWTKVRLDTVIALMGNSGWVDTDQTNQEYPAKHLHLEYFHIPNSENLTGEQVYAKKRWKPHANPEWYLPGKSAPTVTTTKKEEVAPVPDTKETEKKVDFPERIGYPNARNFPPSLDKIKDTLDTKEKRFEAFVKAMGYEDQIDTFRALAKKHKLDIAMIPAVMWADTGYRRHVKHKNNPWNVRDNENGWYLARDTLEEGINEIGEVLNNQYLKKQTTIWWLSGYWRTLGTFPAWPLYATDMSWNWHRNVTNMMSFVHGEQRDHSNTFREQNISV